MSSCALYFPDTAAQQRATARLVAAGVNPVESHPYWAATGSVTYRDPDGREVVFAPFVFGVNEPAEGRRIRRALDRPVKTRKATGVGSTGGRPLRWIVAATS